MAQRNHGAATPPAGLPRPEGGRVDVLSAQYSGFLSKVARRAAAGQVAAFVGVFNSKAKKGSLSRPLPEDIEQRIRILAEANILDTLLREADVLQEGVRHLVAADLRHVERAAEKRANDDWDARDARKFAASGRAPRQVGVADHDVVTALPEQSERTAALEAWVKEVVDIILRQCLKQAENDGLRVGGAGSLINPRGLFGFGRFFSDPPQRHVFYMSPWLFPATELVLGARSLAKKILALAMFLVLAVGFGGVGSILSLLPSVNEVHAPIKAYIEGQMIVLVSSILGETYPIDGNGIFPWAHLTNFFANILPFFWMTLVCFSLYGGIFFYGLFFTIWAFLPAMYNILVRPHKRQCGGFPVLRYPDSMGGGHIGEESKAEAVRAVVEELGKAGFTVDVTAGEQHAFDHEPFVCRILLGAWADDDEWTVSWAVPRGVVVDEDDDEHDEGEHDEDDLW